jgi:serine protease Do
MPCRLSPPRTSQAALASSIAALLVLWAGSLCAPLGQAQTPLQATAVQAAMERVGPITPEKRGELYQELERHAQVLESQSAVLKTVAKLVGPTVVHIEAEPGVQPGTTHGHAHRVEEAGSGVIMEWKGKTYILTNRHVVRGSALEDIRVTLADGRQVHPTRVWEDAETDVAVLATTATELVAAPLGNSDKLEIGDFVLALGSPFGLSHSVTFGIVSAKGRRGDDLRLADNSFRFQEFIQTDAAINPGNSGGPLVNLRGEVVGINTAIASQSGVSEGVGFSIPINMFAFAARQLIDRGSVVRAFLGVTLNPKFGPTAAAAVGLPFPIGAQVTTVTPNSPADAAKLQVGDVLLEYNHVRVESDYHLINLVSLTEIGSHVPVSVLRNGQTFSLEVTVADKSKF